MVRAKDVRKTITIAYVRDLVNEMMAESHDRAVPCRKTVASLYERILKDAKNEIQFVQLPSVGSDKTRRRYI